MYGDDDYAVTVITLAFSGEYCGFQIYVAYLNIVWDFYSVFCQVWNLNT